VTPGLECADAHDSSVVRITKRVQALIHSRSPAVSTSRGIVERMSGEPTEVPAPDGAGVQTTLEAEPGATARTELEAPIRAGDVLAERYRIVERIGSGGMGSVYLAEHIAIDKPVAIKVLGQEFTHRERLVQRFLQEARTASRIRHEHIVDITDFGYVRDGVPFFAMEYLEGCTLAERIRAEGRLPWPRARRIFLQICTALQAAHREGVVHRDMKPDNVFLVERSGEPDFVKVLDFGIAKLLTEEADRGLTQTGAVIGTAAYMSPEQAQSLDVDPRTDVYSAGIILYQMLTGRVPFEADGFLGILAKHLTERPPSLRAIAPDARIPVAVEREVLKALRKQREERHGSAGELAEALASIDDMAPTRSRRWLPLGMGIGIAAAVSTTWWWSSTREHEPMASTDPDPPLEPAALSEAVGTNPEQKASGATSNPTPAAGQPGGDPSSGEDLAGGQPGGDPSSGEEPAIEPTTTGTPGSTSPPDEVEPVPPSPPDEVEPVPPSRPERPRQSPVVREQLSRDDIDRALKKVRKRADACAKRHYGLGEVRVKVTFSIAASGHVTSASAHSPFGALPLGRCFAEAVQAIRFPRAQGPIQETRDIVGG
jgi:serine/threonine protein kinase